MANVVCRKGMSEFQRASPNDQVGEWHGYPFYRLLATNACDDLGSGPGDRMNRDMLFQFVQKPAAVLRLRLRAGVVDAMAQFGDGQSADNNRNITGGVPEIPNHVGRSEFPALGRNQNARIDN